MQRRESIFTSKFKKWVYHNWDEPSYFEIKTSKDGELSIPFSSVSSKQEINLRIKKFVHKFSDYDRLGTPLDMISFKGKGYMVFHFYRKGNKEFFLIPIERWFKERETSKRKSLTEDRATELGIAYYLN